MAVPSSFDYAIIRVVPRVEREEFINAGVILFCRTERFLGAHIELNTERLRSLAQDIDLLLVQRHLNLIPLICSGSAEAGAIAHLSQSERFHWLVSPRSTIIQTSPVHSGICSDPRDALQHLLETMVRIPTPL
jgi:hypothetical protein